MKRLILSLFTAVALALAGPTLLIGCAGPNAIVQKVPDGPNAKISAALVSVTTARDLLTVAVNADKVSSADAQNLRMQLNTARASIDVAQDLFKTNPAGGDARLTAATAAINAVRAYLLTQGAK